MMRSIIRYAAVTGLITLAPAALIAQSDFSIAARLAPQFHSYKVGGTTDLTVSEMAVPLYVIVPVTQRLTFDLGTSFAQSQVKQNGATSTISGLTDTQLRGNLSLGNDFVVLTAGVNLPTGKSEVPADQIAAAGLIGSDFLSFPISNMGSGFGGTGGIAIARPLGSWSVGLGASVRHTAGYKPFESTDVLQYRPGNEYRARVGIDHPLGTGRFTFGFTYLTFGNDDLAGSVYNTGDRYLTEINLDNSVGAGRLSFSGWNLFRAKGTIVDGSVLDHENISSGELAYSIPAGSATIEPSVEGRMWSQVNASASYFGTIGLAAQFGSGTFSVVPSVGYTAGTIATPAAASSTATLTGFRGMLTIRIR